MVKSFTRGINGCYIIYSKNLKKLYGKTFESQYKKLLLKCLNEGEESENRTGINTYKLFNETININLQNNFPIITGKKIFFKKALAEFKWMFEGKTDIDYLNKHNINWWNEYTDTNDLGKVYGHQIRKYNNTIDQIEYVVKELKNNSRRAIITLWNPSDLNSRSLAVLLYTIYFCAS